MRAGSGQGGSYIRREYQDTGDTPRGGGIGLGSDAAAKRRARTVVGRLRKEYPDAHCALRFEDPLQLLVAAILSAQSTDERVNTITPELFRRYPTPRDFAAASQPELEEAIRTVGLFRNKARSIQAACREIAERHGGEVPRTMEALSALPGIGRKTANVILGTAFGIPSGITVDTHVHRLSRRLGLCDPAEENTDRVERALLEVIPQPDWIFFGHALIQHGRQVCHARRPRCSQCVLQDVCPRNGVTVSD